MHSWKLPTGILELWVGVVGACTWLQAVVWSLSVINTLKAAKSHE